MSNHKPPYVLFEVAAILYDDDGNAALVVPPTPIMALNEEAARYETAFLARKANDNININDVSVLVRPFQ